MSLGRARRTALAAVMAGAFLIATWLFSWHWLVVIPTTLLVPLVAFAWPEHDCGVHGCPMRDNPWHSHAKRRQR